MRPRARYACLWAALAARPCGRHRRGEAGSCWLPGARIRTSWPLTRVPPWLCRPLPQTLLDMIAKIERGEQVFARRAPAPAGHQQPQTGQQRYGGGYGAGAGYGGGQAQQHGGAYKQQTPPPAHGSYGGGYGGGYQNQNQPQPHAGGGPVQDRFW